MLDGKSNYLRSKKKRRDLKQLWEYVSYDESDKKPSWKYLDCIIREKVNGKNEVVFIKNPHFAYEHLSPYDPRDIDLKKYRELKEQSHETI